MPRITARVALAGLALAGCTAAPGAAQERMRASGLPRFSVSGFAGRFIDFGGFSDDQNTFFSFDDATAFGGSLHVRVAPATLFGLDVVRARPAYRRFDKSFPPTVVARGDATTLAVLASARLAGGGGPLGLYLTGAGGAFFWDIEELGGRDADPALMIGLGLEYPLRGGAAIFGEYSQWWVFHPKDETVKNNTANHSVVRFGLRYGL